MWGWLNKLVQHKKPQRTAQKPKPERINNSTLKKLVQHKKKTHVLGRPPILHKKPTSRMDIRIESTLLDKFREYCERHNISMTHALTVYMQRALTEEENQNYHNLVALRLKPKRKQHVQSAS